MLKRRLVLYKRVYSSISGIFQRIVPVAIGYPGLPSHFCPCLIDIFNKFIVLDDELIIETK